MRPAALLLALLAAPLPAAAEEGREAAPPPLTLEALCVDQAELPESIRPVRIRAAPTPARGFYEAASIRDLVRETGGEEAVARFPGDFWDSVPAVRGRRAQSFVADGGSAGTVFLLEYGSPCPESLRGFLRGHLGGDGPRSREHPDEVLIHERFLWILSFPVGDPAAEWVKDRLRRKFRIPAVRHRRDLAPLISRARTLHAQGDNEEGVRLLSEDPAATADCALAQYLLGECAVGAKEWAVAEKAYRRAMELHDSLEDPLSDGAELVWACLDGWGTALLYLRRLEEAAAILRRALEVGRGVSPGQWSVTQYNLACTEALRERWPEALEALRRAVEGNPEFREMARTDGDLEKARAREEFRDLLR